MAKVDYATLAIHRKVARRTDYLYTELYNAYKKGESLESVLIRENINPAQFGEIRFIERLDGTYFEHVPFSKKDRQRHQLEANDRDFPVEWLMCFAFKEMETLGLDMAVFQADASVEEVLERFQWIEINDFNLMQRRNQLVRWIKANAHPEDRLFFCTNWLFFHEQGKYDYDFVTTFVNRKIQETKQEAKLYYWTKNETVRPEQMKMNAG